MSERAPRTSVPEPGQWVGRVQSGVLLDAPVKPRAGGAAWVGVVWPDDRAPGGWARTQLVTGPHGRGYVAARWTMGADGHRHVAALLSPGDVIEFGADYPRRLGRRRSETVAVRWYGVVLMTGPERLVAWGPFGDPKGAWDVAQSVLDRWRTSQHVEVSGITDAPAGDAASAPWAQTRREGGASRVDDTRDPTPDADAVRSAEGPVGDRTRPSARAEAAYRGSADGTVVRRDAGVTERALRPSRQWSPDGFGWGHDGDTASELSYALLADASGSPDAARRLASRYNTDVVAHLPSGRPWSVRVEDVRRWVVDAALDTAVAPTWTAPGAAASASTEAGL